MPRILALLTGLVLLLGPASSAVKFMLPHTHWEPFGIKNPEEVYQQVVKMVFQRMSDSLGKHARRRFSYADVEFVRMYLEEAADTREQRIGDFKRFIKSGQLEIVNGAVTEMDPTISATDDIWANWFHGLQYLEKTLDYRPRTAWLLHQQGTTNDTMHTIHALGFSDLFLAGIGKDVYDALLQKRELQLLLDLDKGRYLRTHVVRDMVSPNSLRCDVDCDTNKMDMAEYDHNYAITGTEYALDCFWLVGGMLEWNTPETRFAFLQNALHKRMEYGIELATPSEYADALAKSGQQLPTDKVDFTVKRTGSVTKNGHYNLANHLKQRIRGFGKTFRALKNYLLWSANAKGFDPAVRQSIADKLAEIGRKSAELMHHELTRAQANRPLELQAQERIDQAHNALVSLLTLTKHENPIVCDFRNFDLTGAGCDGYLKILTKGGSMPFKILNPTLTKVNHLFRIPIPNDANSGKYFLRFGKSSVRSTLVCFRGLPTCWLYFALYLDPVSVLSLTLRTPSGPAPTQGLLTERVESAFTGLGADPIVLRFSSFTVTIQKEGLTVQNNLPPGIKQSISVRKIVTEDCSKEHMTYRGTEPQELVGNVRAYSVFRTRVIEGVFVQGDGFTLRLFQRPDSKHYAVELSVDEDKTQNKCRDVYLSIENPMSAGLTFQADGTSVTSDALYPVKDTFTVAGAEWGSSVFLEEPRGVIFTEAQLLIGLTRKLLGDRNEKFVGKFTVYNWNRRDPSDVVFSPFEEIHRNFDVDFPFIFGGKGRDEGAEEEDEGVAPEADATDVEEGVGAKVQLPPGLRFHLEQVAADGILIRFDNKSKVTKVSLVPTIVIESLFGEGRAAFEVPLSTVFTVRDRKPLAKSYQLGPGDGLAVLVEAPKLVTAEN